MSNSVNNKIFNFCGGIPFRNPKFKRLKIVSGASGDVKFCLKDGSTIYTPPAGRIAIPWGPIYVKGGGAGTVTYYPQITISSTNYRLFNDATIGTTQVGNLTTFNCPIILAGENIGFNFSASGVSAVLNIIEVDAKPIVRGLIAGLVSGDNTLYTCPSGKNAVLMSVTLGKVFGQANEGYIIAYNPTANGSLTRATNIVPSGGSPTTYNKFDSSGGTGQYLGSNLANMALSAGDYININTGSGSGQIAWVNILEIEQ